jgi:uridine phosphorylase
MLKECHFTPQRMLSMLGLKADSLGPLALIPGPKERSDMLLKLLEGPQKNFTFLDYEMYTGTLDGTRVTVGNGGRYAPDTSITTEILCAAGAQSLIRVGSCGSLQDHVKIGDLVIVTGALRGDGTSRYYVPESFSTIAHSTIVEALRQAAEDLQVRYHLGLIFTTDALFQETPELITQLNQQNVSSIDMVTSTFLTIAQVRGKKAGAVLAVSDECLYGKFGFRDPQFLEAEQKTIDVARRALRYVSS